MAAIVGNEDGARHVSAGIFQAVSEAGFTIPSGGATCWVSEAMGSTNYMDLASTPTTLTQWTPTPASNAAHLAALLKQSNYPGRKAGR